MEIKLASPTHVCPECGEWWAVEPMAQDRWRVTRYGDHSRRWSEEAFLPSCPKCENTILTLWLIDDVQRDENR